MSLSGRAIRLETAATWNVDALWNQLNTTNYKLFQVQTCQDARVLLTPSWGDKGQGYEVLLGTANNTRSSIKRLPYNDNYTLSTSTSGILDCQQMRSFWIRLLIF